MSSKLFKGACALALAAPMLLAGGTAANAQVGPSETDCFDHPSGAVTKHPQGAPYKCYGIDDAFIPATPSPSGAAYKVTAVDTGAPDGGKFVAFCEGNLSDPDSLDSATGSVPAGATFIDDSTGRHVGARDGNAFDLKCKDDHAPAH